MAKLKTQNENASEAKKKRSHLLQTDVPRLTLDQALRVPQAIADHYASKTVTPLKLASALKMSPTSGPFRTLCGAAIAYGLTAGGCKAKEIVIEPIGKRITRPTVEQDDSAAKRQAVLKPRVTSEFLRKYDTNSVPRVDIALNVLVEMGVPEERAEAAFKMIMDSARSVGFISEIKGKEYVELSGVLAAEPEPIQSAEVEADSIEAKDVIAFPTPEVDDSEGEGTTPPTSEIPAAVDQRTKRVFITHGKNKAFLDLIKKLLSYGELIPVVSVDKSTVSKPVPEKVMEDMRSCGAAIIHVEAEEALIDKEGNERTIINENVLIEIGAAMALYGKRYILLVEEGVKLPSKLQGLFEVRYEGSKLDGEDTIRLLDAINDIKNQPLPRQ